MNDRSIQSLRQALNVSKGFIYRYDLALVVISVGWFFFSLPIITIGPASVGAYRAVEALRTTGRVDRREVVRTVRANFLGATMLGLLPFVFGAIGASYLVLYLRSGSTIALVLSLVTGYLSVHTALVLIPTFVWMAHGYPGHEAIRRGYIWTVTHPTLSLTMGLLTVVLAVVTLLFMVAFVLLFAGVSISFHLELVSGYVDPK